MSSRPRPATATRPVSWPVRGSSRPEALDVEALSVGALAIGPAPVPLDVEPDEVEDPDEDDEEPPPEDEPPPLEEPLPPLSPANGSLYCWSPAP